MATQKKVAQSRAQVTVQQSSPGKTKVPRLAREKAPEVPKVTQADLEELIYLRRLLDEAHERWVAKRENVRRALVGGARIENGVHLAVVINDEKIGDRLLVR